MLGIPFQLVQLVLRLVSSELSATTVLSLIWRRASSDELEVEVGDPHHNWTFPLIYQIFRPNGGKILSSLPWCQKGGSVASRRSMWYNCKGRRTKWSTAGTGTGDDWIRRGASWTWLRFFFSVWGPFHKIQGCLCNFQFLWGPVCKMYGPPFWQNGMPSPSGLFSCSKKKVRR